VSDSGMIRSRSPAKRRRVVALERASLGRCPSRSTGNARRASPPEIEAFLQPGITSARTEGYNRVIKQIKRVACGFRNQDNYERRIMLHHAAHRAA